MSKTFARRSRRSVNAHRFRTTVTPDRVRVHVGANGWMDFKRDMNTGQPVWGAQWHEVHADTVLGVEEAAFDAAQAAIALRGEQGREEFEGERALAELDALEQEMYAGER